jgi:hypothetical protein
VGGRGQLVIEVNGPGRIHSEPAGLACPGDCRAVYPVGTIVTLNATPAEQFVGWEGGACSGTSPIIQVVTEGATRKICRANFKP